MIKITLEDDTGLVGYKDKNAWTYEDAIAIFQDIIKQVYNLPDNYKLEGRAKLPETKINEHALDEGM
tara:strand:- start:4 stop:204 length:201 start_codon:yes stop_codon:yes gene_type:complete